MEKTINEARADYGLSTIDNGDAVMITTSKKADSQRYPIRDVKGKLGIWEWEGKIEEL